MPQIRLEMPQHVLDSIHESIRGANGRAGSPPSANDIAREALAVYKWAIEQVRDGYAVVSMNARGELVEQIATPNLPPKAPTRR